MSRPFRKPAARPKSKPAPLYARPSAPRPAFKPPARKTVNRPNSIFAASEEPAYSPPPEPTYHPISAAPRAGARGAEKPAAPRRNGTKHNFR